MPTSSTLAAGNLTEDPLGWNCGWRRTDRPSLGDFAGRVARFLRAIRPLHTDMEALLMHSRRSSAEHASPWIGDSAVIDWVLHHAWEPRPPSNCRYDQLDRAGHPTARSRGRMGFTLHLGNRRVGDRQLSMSIHDTGPDGGGVGLVVPAAHVADYAAEGWFEALWDAVAREWPVQYGATLTRAWRQALKTAEPPSDWVMRDVGGCTFSSDPSLVEAVPEGVPWHTLPSGGIAVCITRRPDRLLAADVARAIDFRDRLQRAGMARLWRLD